MKPRKSQTVMTHKVQLAALRTRTGGKQPGRKYGPRPKGPGAIIGTPPKGTEQREEAYRRQSGRKRRPQTRYDDAGAPQAYARINGLTTAQRRRSWHKALSAARREGDRALTLAVDKELEALGAVPVQRERKAEVPA